MSYEGYDVWYCENGHLVEELDTLESNFDPEDAPVCPVCNKKVAFVDCVNETNGCECIPGGHKCSAHPTITKVLGWDSVPCEVCKGTRYIDIDALWQDTPCSCGSKTCLECHGTGTKRVPLTVKTIHCKVCKGTGLEYAEVWDISSLVEKVESEEVAKKWLKEHTRT